MRILLPLLSVVALSACQGQPLELWPRAAAAPGHSAATAPAPGIIDEEALDRAANPCDDFYQFACGSWLARTPIPADRSVWSRSFSEISERNQKLLHEILDATAAGKPTPPGADNPYGRKLGDFYATCMDEKKAETASLATLKEGLGRIDAIHDADSLAAEVARLHLDGVPALFRFDSQQDFKDAQVVIGVADQGGLGLPDRDYYLKDDDKSVEIRKHYAEHVSKMLRLLGAAAPANGAQAQTVLTIETALARASLPRVDRRDPHKIYHRLERAGLVKQAPGFAWDAYFKALGYPGVQAINVAVPEFFTGLSELVGKTPLPELKGYLRWQALHDAAPALSKQFVDENFRFRAKNLTGEKQILPRWKRCVEATDHALGEALGRPFVAEAFGAEGKARSQEMISGIEKAFEANLRTLGWMDAPTRAQAQDKLRRIFNKIGYPDHWRDYDKLKVDRASYLKNRLRAAAFETRRQLDKIGKPLDRAEWYMSPPTVNAYYDSSLNEMVFPAGILQPPFFNRAAGASTNYGAIGMVMGHELTHGFDDEGRLFDGAGNLREWWTRGVGKAFTERAECVARQYDGYSVLDGQHLNGHLTLGENIADIGGIKMAYAAWRAARAGQPQPPGPKVAGFSEEQQFFLSFAQSWCTNTRPEATRMRLIVDTHSPPQFRVNGPLADTPEFQSAFQCKPGSKMVPPARCTVW